MSGEKNVLDIIKKKEKKKIAMGWTYKGNPLLLAGQWCRGGTEYNRTETFGNAEDEVERRSQKGCESYRTKLDDFGDDLRNIWRIVCETALGSS